MIAEHGSVCPGSELGHTAISGGMYVDSEDIRAVAKTRRDLGEFPIECETCDATYSVTRGWQE